MIAANLSHRDAGRHCHFEVRFRTDVGSTMASLREPLGQPVRNWDACYRFKNTQYTLIVLVFNPGSTSQAGRRGFESRLPLHFLSITCGVLPAVSADFGAHTT